MTYPKSPDSAPSGSIETEKPRDSGPKADQCQAITRSGKRCRGRALPDGSRCAFHSIDEAERIARARRGGLARSNRNRATRELATMPAMDAAAIGSAVAKWISQLEAGQLEAGRAAALGSLARVALSALPAIDLADLERRIDRLENPHGGRS